jgi:hypothetical protein
MGDGLNRQPSTELAEKLKQGLATLSEAFEYAVDTDSDRWNFAVTIGSLRTLGLNDADLRWLVRKGYVEHGREVTVQGYDGREFRSTGDLTFTSRTCLVLTDVGVASARTVLVESKKGSYENERPATFHVNGKAVGRPIVQWDAETRNLRVNGETVKRFRWPAANQETVLNTFQELSWPERIDDPLPPQGEQDPKRRLSDTIKCLNRKQTRPLLHFRGDGTGEGVIWEFLPLETETNDDS